MMLLMLRMLLLTMMMLIDDDVGGNVHGDAVNDEGVNCFVIVIGMLMTSWLMMVNLLMMRLSVLLLLVW